MFFVFQFTLHFVENDGQAAILTHLLGEGRSVELSYVGGEVLHEFGAVLSELTLEFTCEFGCSQADLDHNLVRLVIRVLESNITNHDGLTLFLVQFKNWHSSLVHHLVAVL